MCTLAAMGLLESEILARMFSSSCALQHPSFCPLGEMAESQEHREARRCWHFVVMGRSFVGRLSQSCGAAGLRGSPVSSEPEFRPTWLPAVSSSRLSSSSWRWPARRSGLAAHLTLANRSRDGAGCGEGAASAGKRLLGRLTWVAVLSASKLTRKQVR